MGFRDMIFYKQSGKGYPILYNGKPIKKINHYVDGDLFVTDANEIQVYHNGKLVNVAAQKEEKIYI